MYFSEEFITALRDDPIKKTLELCDDTIGQIDQEDSNGWGAKDFGIMLEAYALLAEITDAGLLPKITVYPDMSGDNNEDCTKIYRYILHVRTFLAGESSKLQLESLRGRFRLSLRSGFVYEFSQGDLAEVQDAVNNLRELIASANLLEDEHRQRLLRRLEKLQSELHKKMSDLDRFWGLIGDAGIVLGKLGNDAKPIVDRIREIADIVWRTQSRAEELPSGTQPPFVERKPDKEE